ncbi:MAG: hypothetical protein OEY29_15305 [Gammaproteobacteria bacterium]|nr:hypothetical protein [Gammaproteobacteria bacterium]
MQTIISRILILGSLAILAACGGGADPAAPTLPTITASLIAADSSSIDLQGTDLQGPISTACYANNSNGIVETVSISGLTWTYTVNTHPGDTTCANTPTTTTAVATLTIDSDQTVVNWVDDIQNPVAAPANIPADAPYTLLHAVITSSDIPYLALGSTLSLGYVIDNSSTDGVVLYSITNIDEATIAYTYTNIVPATPPVVLGADINITIDSVVNTAINSSTITYTVTNTGDTATGSFDVMAWYHRATAPVYGDASSGSFNIHDLAAGASVQGTITFATTLMPGMTFDAYVVADFSQAVGESDEGLTGTNDNLAMQTWTVSDIFNFLSTDYIESTQVDIYSAYSPSTDRTTISMRVASGSPAFFIQLAGEVTGPGTYTLSTGGVISTAYSAQFSTYTINNTTPTDTPVTITIDGAGAAGEVIYGSYNATLCNVGGSGTCSNTTNYTGSFFTVRDANTP